jgi:hypothetical protein
MKSVVIKALSVSAKTGITTNGASSHISIALEMTREQMSDAAEALMQEIRPEQLTSFCERVKDLIEAGQASGNCTKSVREPARSFAGSVQGRRT